MKKVLVLAIAALLTCNAFAQDVNEATDLFNNGASSLSTGDKAGALSSFNKALEIAVECGEDGLEIVAQCHDIIPSLMVSVAKDHIKAAQYSEAVALLKEAVVTATAFENTDKAAEAQALIPQVYMQQGGSLLKAKDFQGAINAYACALEIDPSNGRAALFMGQAYDKLGNQEEAVKSYLLAAANGQEKNANKQLCALYLKKSVAALQAHSYQESKTLAEKALSYGDDAKAYRIAGQAAMNLSDNATAIAYFQKYVELAPTANDAADIRNAITVLEKQVQK